MISPASVMVLVLVLVQSLFKNYLGRFCGGAARLASLLVAYRFLPNMLASHVSPFAPPRPQTRAQSSF
jgi:hypothetical protein